MNSLDDAIKTFLVWKGVGHVTMIGYAGVVGYLLLSGFWAGDKLTTQQSFIISTATAMLPVMLNFYSQVMATTARETK